MRKTVYDDNDFASLWRGSADLYSEAKKELYAKK